MIFVACLCAAWCGSCREYEVAFRALAERLPAWRCVWVDVEDQPEVVGEIDVENFPTLVVQHGAQVLFCGPMLPHISQLERLLETFSSFTPQQAQAFVAESPVRLAWQGVADVQGRLALLPGFPH